MYMLSKLFEVGTYCYNLYNSLKAFYFKYYLPLSLRLMHFLNDNWFVFIIPGRMSSVA